MMSDKAIEIIKEMMVREDGLSLYLHGGEIVLKDVRIIEVHYDFDNFIGKPIYHFTMQSLNTDSISSCLYSTPRPNSYTYFLGEGKEKIPIYIYSCETEIPMIDITTIGDSSPNFLSQNKIITIHACVSPEYYKEEEVYEPILTRWEILDL